MSEESAKDTENPECDETDGDNLDSGSSISLINNPDETKPGDLTEDDASPIVTDSGPTLQARYHDRGSFNLESIANSIPTVIDEDELEKYSRYKMNHGKRGIALIFNNEKFKDDKLKQRLGTTEDGRVLRETLEGIGFEVLAIEDHSNHDCLLVAFMTHGKKGGEICASDDSFKVEEVFEKFKSDKVPTLAGKPKIFLFQACRGMKQDEGVNALRNATSSVTTDSDSARYFSLPTTADFLFLYSSMEGYVSHRSTTKGTWFIQDFCTELKKDARSKDMLSIVTNTLKRVALTRFIETDHPGGWQQMPVFMSTLTRFLYFYDAQ
ncbi:hypothetical protein J437_LFUL004807 [Ladona fulva]|uniref:Caspase-3 n=1 Tax=Ladona fulva TaxID=123851 RepID=A0A8K0NVN1_LADFU|nr:hypothetical protein J437_LFUL004807 [Ladona fulva]